MSSASPKLDWCVVRLGKDLNWWVSEISDSVHWDVDGLGILDPKQVSHVMDLLDPFLDYGLDNDIVDEAFFTFAIEREGKDEQVHLQRVKTSLLNADQPLFALPDILDEEKGPYADFLDHITKLRVKMLNSLISFEEKLTIEELEEEIREVQNADFLEGRAVHFINEISSILEFVPKGFEDEIDEDDVGKEEEGIGDDIPDLEEDTKDIEGDKSLRWEEEEEGEIGEEDDISR